MKFFNFRFLSIIFVIVTAGTLVDLTIGHGLGHVLTIVSTAFLTMNELERHATRVK